MADGHPPSPLPLPQGRGAGVAGVRQRAAPADAAGGDGVPCVHGAAPGRQAHGPRPIPPAPPRPWGRPTDTGGSFHAWSDIRTQFFLGGIYRITSGFWGGGTSGGGLRIEGPNERPKPSQAKIPFPILWRGGGILDPGGHRSLGSVLPRYPAPQGAHPSGALSGCPWPQPHPSHRHRGDQEEGPLPAKKTACQRRLRHMRPYDSHPSHRCCRLTAMAIRQRLCL